MYEALSYGCIPTAVVAVNFSCSAESILRVDLNLKVYHACLI